MPTQQRFEGDTLEAVLDDVRAKVGDDAVITSANKLRKGGLGGFFARERFEVLVDIDEDGDDDLPPAAQTPAVKAPAAEPMSLLELAERVSDEEARAAVDSNPLEFDAVLNQVIRAEPLVSTPRYAAPQYSAVAPAAEPVVPARTSMPSMPSMPSIPAAPSMPAAPRPRSRPLQAERAPMSYPAVVDTACDPGALVELGLPEPLSHHVARGLDATASITAALEHLPRPEPLPTTGGSVIAVVGDRSTAMNLAHAIAKELRISRQSVVLATASSRNARSMQLSTPQEAYDTRRSWRRRKTPTIVAIECEVGRSNTSWAEHVLDALEPSMTWATVDASRKPEDVTAWADLLGGVDALAVLDLDETVSPAAVLRTGIPVGFIDGDVATPEAWAKLLTDRIAA